MSTEQTKAVLDRHMEALSRADLDALMADYTEDSRLISNMGEVMRGLDGIRGVFTAITSAKPVVEQTVEHVDDDVAYVAWKAEGIPFGSDTFVIRDDKILIQTVALHFG